LKPIFSAPKGGNDLPIHYERDEFAHEEYSDQSINMHCVASWSINDAAQRRTVVNVIMPDGTIFNSAEAKWFSEGRLEQLIDCLRLIESGGRDKSRTRPILAGTRASRVSLRDYEEESRRVFSLLPPVLPKWRHNPIRSTDSHDSADIS
jgi:hypothetical protein